jgi:hypothetical protein
VRDLGNGRWFRSEWGGDFVIHVETQFPNVSTTFFKKSCEREYRCDPSTAQQIVDCYGRMGVRMLEKATFHIQPPADSDADASDSDDTELGRKNLREMDDFVRQSLARLTTTY